MSRNRTVTAALTLLGLLGLIGAGAFLTGEPGGREQRSPEPRAGGLRVERFSADYVYQAENVRQLAKQAVVAVRAKALDSRYEPGEDPGLVYTLQLFQTVKTYWGDPGKAFTVFFTGGVVDGPQGRYLLEDAENPQYQEGREYFLLLARHDAGTGEFVAIGPSQGRYLIGGDGRLHALEAARAQPIESLLHGKAVLGALEVLKRARG